MRRNAFLELTISACRAILIFAKTDAKPAFFVLSDYAFKTPGRHLGTTHGLGRVLSRPVRRSCVLGQAVRFACFLGKSYPQGFSGVINRFSTARLRSYPQAVTDFVKGQKVTDFVAEF